jgi:hypothetical protein
MDVRHGGKSDPIVTSPIKTVLVKVPGITTELVIYCTSFSSSTTTFYIFSGESSQETNQRPTKYTPQQSFTMD